jgi:nucleotide-binding universal stress UspA family protein/RimJ/RimL family protein N-acetyltransferase
VRAGSIETTLRGDRTAILRPLEREDRERLVAGFERLSPESRYRRFFRSMEHMSERDLAYLTEIDHHDHEAIIAFDPRSDDAAIGVARYVRSREDRKRAEAAVVVADDWQGRGLGKQLLERLSRRATEEGIERFTALVQADNHRAVDLLASLGPTSRSFSEGLVELDIELEQDRLSNSLASALRAAAGAAFGTRPLSERLVRKARDLYLGRSTEIPGRYALSAPIVVGTDGSPGAERAVARAAELAKALGAPLHAVTAERAPAAARAALDNAQTIAREAGIEASTHSRDGEAAETLLDLAEELGAGLVVVGDKGMRSTARFVLGSVPDRLSHAGVVNVLIEHTSDF